MPEADLGPFSQVDALPCLTNGFDLVALRLAELEQLWGGLVRSELVLLHRDVDEALWRSLIGELEYWLERKIA